MRWVLLVAVTTLMVAGEGVAAQTPTQGVPLVAYGPWAGEGVPMRGVTPHLAMDANVLLALQVRRANHSWARRGAVLGAVAGGVAAYLVLHSGGSTSLCDRSANQDAMGQRECIGLTVAGSAAGAGLGAWIGGRFRSPR